MAKKSFKYKLPGLDRRAIKKQGMKPIPLGLMRPNESFKAYIERAKEAIKDLDNADGK